jgi:sensor histidine kinase regulating citrate/malate metabolism
MGNLIKSGNSIIDYLINSKLSNLNNVKVLISGYVGNYSDIDEMDLACILGNVLDNAIEAQQSVKGEKRIELHFLYKNAARIIVCKNTVGGSVLKNNKDLPSTKDSSELHGLGHRIVETTVKKYGGIVDYYEDGEMFGVQILLPIKA